MHRLFLRACLLLAASAFLSPGARAAPPDPVLTDRLMAMFDAWGSAIVAGDLNRALTQRDADTAKEIKEATATAAGLDEFLQMARMMSPDSVALRHASLASDGNHAELIVLATKIIPKDVPAGGPPPGAVMRSELTLKFVRDSGGWKFAEQIFGPDPADIKPCHSEAWDGRAAFDDNRSVSAGGRIERVDFAADHTLVVFRVLDEDNCAFLPPRAALQKEGLDAATLVPYAIVELDGWPHRTDPTRMWADRPIVQTAP
jgi:hypothetical protein